MQEIIQQKLTGERALFKSKDMHIVHSVFADGESPLKESRNIKIDESLFKWKYPLWYAQDITVNNSTFLEMARSGIWYTHRITIKDSVIEAPKIFRRSSEIHLNNVDMPNASETFWNCRDITLNQVSAKGDYFAMNSENIRVDGFILVGNYAFDGAKNIEVRNAKIISKDAFWNCENVVVYDSLIVGEYLGWNSKNVRFVNCTLESNQGMCYMEDLVVKNGKILNTDLAFEYSTVDIQAVTAIDSVKNPISGRIQALAIGEKIQDDPEVDSSATQFELRREGERSGV